MNSEGILVPVVLNRSTRNTREEADYVLTITNIMNFSREIALKIPISHNNAIVLSNIIATKREFHSEEVHAIHICGMMSHIMPTLHNAEALKQAVTFTTKLLVNVRKNARSLVEFCRHIHNVKYLVDILSKVDESLCVDLIGLFRVLISIQNIHRIQFTNSIELNLAPLLKGSFLKISKTIKLLTSIFSTKRCLLFISAVDISAIYSKILDFSSLPELEDECYVCIVVILKTNSGLAKDMDTIIHIEQICSHSMNTPKRDNILKMLHLWLELIIKMPLNGLTFINTRRLKRFVMTANLDHHKLQYYINIIDELTKKQELESKGPRFSFSNRNEPNQRSSFVFKF